jgi:acyl-coenzyme A synthetase/AMP-(fatty) acid ligase
LTDDGFSVHADYFYQSPIILLDTVEVYNENEFMLFGRNTDLIKIAGKRALLSDLNHYLLAIDGVKDGTFFMPDNASENREVRLTAFVVAPDISKNEILDQLRNNIDSVFLPRPLKFVDALPRNATGKLPRGKLVEMFEQVSS